MLVLQQMIIFVLLMVVGALARHYKILTPENQPQITKLVVNIAYPAIILSGFATPISSMPEIFQSLTLLNPMRYGLELIQRIFLEGAGFLDLWPLFAAIMAVTVVAVLAAVFSFHHKIS